MNTPEAAGLSPTRMERIRPSIEKYISDTKIAGAVTLLARRGELVHLESYGKSSREQNTPMREDTLFRIYSMTKPVTAAALLCLYERGHFQLTSPVSRFIAGIEGMKVLDGDEAVEQQSQMAIWNLLTHTSGLTYPHLAPEHAQRAYAENVRLSGTSLEELIDGLLKTTLAFQPGTRYGYGFSLDVAARVVEIVSGKSFYQFLKDELFDPLGMNDTFFSIPQDKVHRLSSMYGISNLDVHIDNDKDGPVDSQSKLLSDYTDDYVIKPHEHYRGGHGLVSTAEDYYRFCSMLLGDGELDGVRILSRKTVELMRTNHLAAELLPFENGGMSEPGLGHGLGVQVVIDPGQTHIVGTVGGYGGGGAASTYFWIDPAEELIGIQMAQYQPAGIYNIGTDFRVAAYQAIID